MSDQQEEKVFRQQCYQSNSSMTEEEKTLNCEICVIYNARRAPNDASAKKSIFIGVLPHCEKHRPHNKNDPSKEVKIGVLGIQI